MRRSDKGDAGAKVTIWEMTPIDSRRENNGAGEWVVEPLSPRKRIAVSPARMILFATAVRPPRDPPPRRAPQPFAARL